MNNLKIDKNVTMDSRVSAVCGSINFIEYKHEDLPTLIVELEKKLLANSEWVENYYLIFHDDTDTPHIHYILELVGSIRIKTILNKLENLGYNRESVNIGKLGFLSSMLKYFLHLTEDSLEEGKKVYPIEAILSNMSYEFISNYIECFDDVMTTERLIAICYECNFKNIEIMKRLGLATFHKWRYEINLIKDSEYWVQISHDKANNVDK